MDFPLGLKANPSIPKISSPFQNWSNAVPKPKPTTGAINGPTTGIKAVKAETPQVAALLIPIYMISPIIFPAFS